MTLYGEREGAIRPLLQIAMHRPPRMYAPRGKMQAVARCNNREFYSIVIVNYLCYKSHNEDKS